MTSAMNISMKSDFGKQDVGRSKEAFGVSQHMDFSRVRSHASDLGIVILKRDIFLVHGALLIKMPFLVLPIDVGLVFNEDGSRLSFAVPRVFLQ